MDRVKLHDELQRQRQFMLDEGFLDDRFKMLEDLEDQQPDFVDDIMGLFIPSAADYIQRLQGILDTKPLDLAELERLILKLKGSSASVGTTNITAAVDVMLETFHQDCTNIIRLDVALGNLRSQYNILKSHFEPYLEIMAQLRGAPPKDEESDTDE